MLLKCTECGGDVSDKATACPHCGAPVVLEVPKPEEKTNKEEGFWWPSIPIGLGVLALVCLPIIINPSSRLSVGIIAAGLMSIIWAAIKGFIYLISLEQEKNKPTSTGENTKEDKKEQS